MANTTSPIPTAATLVAASNLTLAVAGRTLLAGASFAVLTGGKVALVGRNGSGKTTLLATVQAAVDSGRPPEHVSVTGRLVVAPGTSVAALPQSPQRAFAGSGRQYLDRYAGEVARAWHRHETLARELADSRAAERLLPAYAQALEAVERLRGWDYPRRLAEVTANLGLGPEHLDRPVARLSGGQATRLALAGVLLSSADLVLLDEPSNSLDRPSLELLAAWVPASPSAVVLVSHDRDLIDACAHEVLEIEEHSARLRLFGGGYSFYAERKLAERQAAERDYEEQVRRRSRLEASARGVSARAQRIQNRSQDDFYRGKAARVARQASAQRTRIARELSRLAGPEPPAQPRMTVAPGRERTGRVLSIHEAFFSYHGPRSVLAGVSLSLFGGDRVAVAGPNGSGKSTLLRLLAGHLVPTSGTVERAPGLRAGLLPQVPDPFDRGQSVLAVALRHYDGPGETLRALLGKVLFADPAGIRAGDLSPGELRRVECAALFAGAPDLAILDEPTNHLDLLSIEMLETALAGYTGALVVVSHDTRFLRHVAPTMTIDLPGPNGQSRGTAPRDL